MLWWRRKPRRCPRRACPRRNSCGWHRLGGLLHVRGGFFGVLVIAGSGVLLGHATLFARMTGHRRRGSCRTAGLTLLSQQPRHAYAARTRRLRCKFRIKTGIFAKSAAGAPSTQAKAGRPIRAPVSGARLPPAPARRTRADQRGRPRMSASTTDVSTWRSGIDQYFLSRRFFSSPRTSENPCFS